MPLPPKEVTCACGHVSTLDRKKLLCIKCGKYIFYDEAEKRRHRLNTIYVVIMFAAAMGFITYIFLEMIVNPLLY
jgi:hypothetical protein